MTLSQFDQYALAVILANAPLLFMPTLLSWHCLGYAVAATLCLHLLCVFKFLSLLSWQHVIFFLWIFIYSQGSAISLQSMTTTLHQYEEKNRQSQTIVAKVIAVGLPQTPMYRQYDSKELIQKITLQLKRIDNVIVPHFQLFTTYLAADKGLSIGQHWKMNADFRAVHSLMNDAGYDAQRRAYALHQTLTAKVTLLALLPGFIDRGLNLRQILISLFLQRSEGLNNQGVLLGLGFGDRALMESTQRELLVKTGIAHLLAISGLHIALAASLMLLFGRTLQFLLPIRLIHYLVPLLFSLILTAIYVYLSGMQPPAIRALSALILLFIWRCYGGQLSTWRLWLACLSLMLLYDPLVILSDSFLLSFFAVFCLLCWFHFVPLSPRLRRWYYAPIIWLYLQVGMCLLLLPLQFLLFHGMALGSIAANLWAVPIVSFITLPLILFSILCLGLPNLSSFLLYCANYSIDVVFWPLSCLSDYWLDTPFGSGLIALMPWLLMCSYHFSLWRYLLIPTLLILPLGLSILFKPNSERWRIDLLDVGHGLAVVIEKRGRAVIYDVGDSWQGGSIAISVILPYLRSRHLPIDQIMISHSHQDHIGGLAEMQRAFPDAKVRTPLLNKDHSPCLSGESWQWQGLNFEVLWPDRAVKYADNSHSCVIRVSDGRFSLLLAGDLEAGQEAILATRVRGRLKSDVLQIGHHGSKTSSTWPFLKAVNPLWGLNSMSRYNRWHFPHPQVLHRYQLMNIPVLNSGTDGQITLKVYPYSEKVSNYRRRWFLPWYQKIQGIAQ